MDVYRGADKVAELDSYDELRVGANRPAFIYEGSELVYPSPVKDGLVLWYDFSGRTNDDAQRDVAQDLSGNGNNGTLQNFNYTTESGYDKNRLLFDGVDDYLEIPELNLSEGATTVQVGDKIYAYDGDKVVTIGEDDGIEAGGKNYVLNSDFSKGKHSAKFYSSTDSPESYDEIIEDPTHGSAYKMYRQSSFDSRFDLSNYPFKIGEVWTLSYLIKGKSEILNQISQGNNANRMTNRVYFDLDTKGKWERRVVNLEIIREKGELDQYLKISPSSDDSEIIITKVMLSKGTKILPYSPAPEDYNTTTLSPSSLRSLQLYNRPLRKNELLQNAESEGLKELKEGVPVQDGLVLHYDFSNESNTSEYREKAFDYSGNGNHGALQNFNFTAESGYNKNKLSFDGVDDYVSFNTINSGENGWSFELVANFVDWEGTSWVNIFGNANSRTLLIHPTGGLGWYINYEDGTFLVYSDISKSSIPTNTPVYISVNCKYLIDNKAEITFRVNDITSTLISNLNPSYSGFKPDTLGAKTGNRMMEWSPSSAKFYNRPLTPDEIAHNYAIEKERFGIE